MKKLKTKKSAQKRFSLFKYSGIKRPQANRTHQLRKKPMHRKRLLKNSLHVVKANESVLQRLLPYLTH